MLPVSAAMLDRAEEYRHVLQAAAHGARADWRFFDATSHAEFLYGCVKQAIDQILPATIRYIERFERFRLAISRFDLAERMVVPLFRRLQENGGRLPERFTTRKFAHLAPKKARQVKEIHQKIFMPEPSGTPASKPAP